MSFDSEFMPLQYFVSVSIDEQSTHPLKDGLVVGVSATLPRQTVKYNIKCTDKVIADAIEVAEILESCPEEEVRDTLNGLTERYTLFSSPEEAEKAIATAVLEVID